MAGYGLPAGNRQLSESGGHASRAHIARLWSNRESALPCRQEYRTSRMCARHAAIQHGLRSPFSPSLSRERLWRPHNDSSLARPWNARICRDKERLSSVPRRRIRRICVGSPIQVGSPLQRRSPADTLSSNATRLSVSTAHLLDGSLITTASR